MAQPGVLFMVSSAAQRLVPTQMPAAQTPKLLDRVRAAIRARHYSLRTEEAYVGWIRRFIHVLNRGGRGVRSPADKL